MGGDQSDILTLYLYVGEHCPLCDKAKQVIYPLLDPDWKFTEINVTKNETLAHRYGLRIPVLRLPDGQEKDWPFSSGQVRRMIEVVAKGN